MKEVLDKLIESLSDGNILLGVVIITVALVFNYKKIVEFLEGRKRARITKLTDALKCEFVTGLTREHLEEELVTEQFKITTGMRLEKQFREAVISAHKSSKGELGFIHFKRALPHLFFEQGLLKVKVSRSELLSYKFNLISGFILPFLGFIQVAWSTQGKIFDITQYIASFGVWCFFISISLLMLSQTFPVNSARKVEKLLLSTAPGNSIQLATESSAK